MCKSAFIYNYGMYRWQEYRYVSVCAIGYYWHDVLLVDGMLSVVYGYVDII